MSGRTTVAKVGDRVHEIPEIWLAGICQANGCTVEEAVRFWDWQVQLGEEIEAASD